MRVDNGYDSVTFSAASAASFKHKLMAWLAACRYHALLDGCQTTQDAYGTYEWLAAGCVHQTQLLTDWQALQSDYRGRWLLGAIGYEQKSAFEPKAVTAVPPLLALPSTVFFEPDVVCYQPRGTDQIVLLAKTDAAAVRQAVEAQPLLPASPQPLLAFASNFTRARYLDAIARIKAHIVAGDTYQVNLSQQFVAQGRLAHPFATFERLCQNSPVPMAAYLRLGDYYALCTSPERFLKLSGDALITQPIKGTIARGTTPAQDEERKRQLAASAKDQAENVMIVDMARNDLHRSCAAGSVQVPHLYQVQTFSKLHHLVSTVTGTKRTEVDTLQAIANAFPPASMTGAPKVRTMQLIDQYEGVGRGLYAGAIGYLAPSGDFDFNVVIRTLVYDAARGLCSYHVGGGITYDSDPAREYDETLLKAQALQEVLSGVSPLPRA
jgi:para-aminobenzoate synthetase component 1